MHSSGDCLLTSQRWVPHEQILYPSLIWGIDLVD